MFAEVQFILSDVGDPPLATLSHYRWNADPELALRPYGMWMYRPVCDPNSEGDLNGDGTVNFTDFLVLSTNFSVVATSHIQGDIDCNGMVGLADFLVLAENFNKAVGAQTTLSVPEPLGLELVGLTGLWGCLLGRRRRP